MLKVILDETTDSCKKVSILAHGLTTPMVTAAFTEYPTSFQDWVSQALFLDGRFVNDENFLTSLFEEPSEDISPGPCDGQLPDYQGDRCRASRFKIKEETSCSEKSNKSGSDKSNKSGSEKSNKSGSDKPEYVYITCECAATYDKKAEKSRLKEIKELLLDEASYEDWKCFYYEYKEFKRANPAWKYDGNW